MIPLKFKTKYFTLEIFRRGIVFTVATLTFASGINLVNGNIFLALISIFNKQLFNENSNEYGFWVGLILILVSLFLFYLIIINWRIEIYSKTFRQVRKCLDKFGTLYNHRAHSNSETLRELHINAYEEYKKTINFLGKYQSLLDVKTYDTAKNISFEIGKKFSEYDTYINEVKKIENGIHTDYSPDLANRELPIEIENIKRQFKEFVDIIKEKEKFKIFNQK